MLVLCVALAACSPGDEPSPGAEQGLLRIGMIPDAGATQAAADDKRLLQEMLASRLGRPVEVIVTTNYAATVEALGNGSVDIAYLGGLTFVRAHNAFGAVPLVQRDIDRAFHSAFIARRESGIDGLDDLAGRSMCFGDVNSTSGHLMPRFELDEAGVGETLGPARNTGSHPATAAAVASGACDAGVLDETVWAKLVADGAIDPQEVAVFHTSAPFADYVWAARPGVPAADRESFSRALLELRRGRDDAVLDVLRGDRYVRANAGDYAAVEATARKLKLL
ncbi:phosphate/phosphite/phosphonate ABC transporter substrate-binding protein [Croceibacterium soli]|uniref:phosphate/phosphite/phosphonate ABC transporter substrate-binding protein n=1 Tax=Croceibacterium soli TaxID=1739690 RepID=UPI002E26C040|nr:phosphate/phosphite/phosphonate ABC transporter substrate-binding protein [Croceibacterium soli]